MEQILLQLAFGYIHHGAYFMTGAIALAWVVLCHGAAWKKGTRLRYFGEFLVLFYLFWLALTIPATVFQNDNSIIRIGLYAVVELLYVHWFADCHKQAKLLLWCSLFAGICCLSTIGGQLQFLVQYVSGDMSLSYTVGKLAYLFMVPLALYLRHFNFGNFTSVPKIGYWLVLTGDLSIVALTAVEIPWMKTDYRVVITLLAGVLCVFVMVLVSVFVIYAMCKEQSAVITLRAEKQRLQSEREMSNITESALEDLRCIRHDLKNQYAYIQILLESGRNEDALSYLRQLSANVLPQLSDVDCGNQSINTILNMEVSKAKKEQITVDHQLAVPPVLPFADEDLRAIIANLMDNAIEECVRLRERGRDHVRLRVEMFIKRSYLFIVCRNTTDKQELRRQQGGLLTTKTDKELHGYGTRIIQKMSEKYNGYAEYSLEDGEFVAMVMLDMTHKEEDT